ncbi:MAG: LysR family transcriptional regulator [Paracoccaceae bacterium]
MRVFLSLARGQSLSAAGRHLRMDPATVGRRIVRLERDLAQTLFTRSPQGYALTDGGMRLLRHTEQAEAALIAANRDLAHAPQTRPREITGQIRVGAPDGCASFLLPQVCGAISARNPALDIQIVSVPRVVNLSRREADIAITVSPPTGGRLTVQKITDYHLSLAASRAYLDRAGPITSVEDLRHHPIVGYIPDMIFDKELDYLADMGLDRVTLGSNSVAVQFQCLRAGAGVGVVHDFARPAAPELVPVLPEIRLTRAFFLVRHKAEDSGRLSRFAAALSEGLHREVARLEVP